MDIYSRYTGGILGYNYSGTITDCYNMGNISSAFSYSDGSYAHAGGIAGSIISGSIINCYNTGNISTVTDATAFSNSSAYSYAGGIVARNHSSKTSIIDCYNTGDVFAFSRSTYSNSSYAGGILGQSNDLVNEIINCFNTGNIVSDSGNPYAGGITSYNCETIKNCYNTGDISVIGSSSTARAGGIAGGNHWSYESSITNCYNTGNISSNSGSIGGIIGENSSNNTITNSYWNSNSNITINGISDKKGIGFGSGTVIPKTSAEMKNPDFINTLNANIGSNTDWSNWYSDILNINGGYPVFMYQLVPVDQDGEKVTAANIGGAEEIIIPAPGLSGTEITPIIAFYKDGKMLLVYTDVDSGLTDEKLTVNMNAVTTPQEFDRVKIFIWKDFETILPQIPVIEIK